MMQWNYWAAEVKHDEWWLGQLRHLGHLDIYFGIPKDAVKRSVISGWDN